MKGLRGGGGKGRGKWVRAKVWGGRLGEEGFGCQGRNLGSQYRKTL